MAMLDYRRVRGLFLWLISLKFMSLRHHKAALFFLHRGTGIEPIGRIKEFHFNVILRESKRCLRNFDNI